MINTARNVRLSHVSLIALGAVLAQPAFAGAPDVAGNDSPIVVTAAGYQQEIRNAPASISVITTEDLAQKRFGSLAEALDDVPGLDVGGEAGKTGGLNISIRGMDSKYTLVLIDGRRQNAPGSVTPNGFGESSTSLMPPFNAIDRIEVVRGPMSTLYGSDAMGGVINIITRKVGDSWTGSATAESTIQFDNRFGNIQALNGFAQGPIVKDLVGLTLRGSLRNREESNIEIPANPALQLGRNPVQSDAYNYGGRLSFTPHVDHDIWFEYERNETSYDNSTGKMGTLGSGGYAPELKFNRTNYALAHTWRTGLGQLDTTLTRIETENIGRLIPNGTPGKVPGSPRDLEARNDIIDTRFSGSQGPVGYTVGGQYWKAHMVEGVAPTPFEFTQWAGFGEATVAIVETFKLTGGVRYDHHSTFGAHWSPRGYAVWNINDRLTLKGGVSTGYKTPGVEELHDGIIGFGNQGRTPQVGTPTLKPETSLTYEVGLHYESALLDGNFTLFQNDFNDKIVTAEEGLLNCSYAQDPNRPGCKDVGNFPTVDAFSQKINVDKARTRGFEIGGTLKPITDVTLTANYTYTESEVLSGADAGDPLMGTPKHMFNANLRWSINDQVSTFIRGEVRSSRWRGANAVQEAVGSFDGYELLHLGGTLKVNDNFRLSATIYNLLDTDYAVYLPYNNGASYAPQYSINQEGRRLWISANVDF